MILLAFSAYSGWLNRMNFFIETLGRRVGVSMAVQ
jgi:hypothetical protein